ncbi:MAG: extracellular solute-binding protein [Burkholderiales bacterium]|nr:extracellular solute-binding protein [Burkholderiales bacterium]
MQTQRRRLSAVAVILSALLGAASLQGAETVLLVSGERPPYLGAALPEGGYAAELVTEAFKRKGFRVRLEFYTWARAKLQATQGDADGMLASEPGPADAAFVYSTHFPGGTTGLLKKKSLALAYRPDEVNNPALLFKSLAGYKLGAVRDGVSLPAFEQAAGLNKELAADELRNLDMLEHDKVQLSLVDKYTAADIMVSQRPRLIGQLEFMTPPLAQSDFYLAFARRGKNHLQLLQAFNAGLAQLRQDGTLEKIMNKHGLFLAKQNRKDKVQLTVGTVNNSDMFVMQGLAKDFEKQYPYIALNWRVLDENTLRLRLLSDLAISDGQFDVMTIGTYELPIWAGRGWLAPLQPLPESYGVDDLLPTVRNHLSYRGQLYALPFYAESMMTYYRKDLFAKAGLSMPARPSYQDILAFAAKLHRPAAGVYGVCLRGKPGWGENMAFIGTLVHAHGGRWFDQQWRPELASPVWQTTISFYAELLGKYGPPNADKNGFNENLALFSAGHCGIWIDATVAAGMLFDPRRSSVSAQLGYAPAPYAAAASGSAWLWSWALAIPNSSKHQKEARQFITWATSKPYLLSVASTHGWIAVPPGTRKSTYADPRYLKAAPFAGFVLNAIESADSMDSSAAPRPYIGIQYVSIPEFQTIGDNTGLELAKMLRGEQSVDKALKRAQNFAVEQMKSAGNSP